MFVKQEAIKKAGARAAPEVEDIGEVPPWDQPEAEYPPEDMETDAYAGDADELNRERAEFKFREQQWTFYARIVAICGGWVLFCVILCKTQSSAIYDISGWQLKAFALVASFSALVAMFGITLRALRGSDKRDEKVEIPMPVLLRALSEWFKP